MIRPLISSFAVTLCATAVLRAENVLETTADAVVVRSSRSGEVVRYVLQKPADSPLAAESACYFHPLRSPSGVVLTDVGPDDHRHHRGVFLAWVEMHSAAGDADFWGWGEHAPTKGRRIVNREVRKTTGTGERVGFTARNEWLADDRVVLHEELRTELATREALHVFDLAYSLTAPAELTLSRWAFSGFCVRMRKENVAAWDPAGAVKLPPPQHTKPESDWPDRPWYAFTLRGNDARQAGVAVLNHSDNPRTLWHNVVSLGMLNPCIVAPAEVKLAPGKSLGLRYRVVTFDGDVPTAKLDAIAREWAQR